MGAAVSASSDNRLAGVARLLGLLSQAALWAAGTGLVAMTAFVAWQVSAATCSTIRQLDEPARSW